MTSSLKKVPLIYNLFPRYFRTIDDWNGEVTKIAEMGFNAIFINPFFETGFSGSLYAVKNYYRLNSLFLKDGQDPSDFSPIDRFNATCRKLGITLIIDLVINHTAKDSVLTQEHPEWYKWNENGELVSPFAIDPADDSNVTVWGDLASIDNESSPKREQLWDYWDSLIAFFQERGINGFRCDAAYQVSVELWKRLITAAKKRDSAATFYAETLGCRLEQIEALAPSGFDYLFNSSKWWNFDHSWAIDQHSTNKHIAPSISFPETHDTERLASCSPKTESVQRSRYAFAALFSEGILMTMGYEFGAVTRMDVVRGSPEDVDHPQWDLTEWIRSVNRLKLNIPVLSEEGTWRPLNPYSQQYLFLEKSSSQGHRPVYVCVNKSPVAETEVEEWALPELIRANCSHAISLLTDELRAEPIPLAFTLDPADVVLFLSQ